MLVDGQYPGITNSSLAPVTGTWVVYLGPGTSSEQILNLCLDPKHAGGVPEPLPDLRTGRLRSCVRREPGVQVRVVPLPVELDVVVAHGAFELEPGA